jgi:hypothetical protein
MEDLMADNGSSGMGVIAGFLLGVVLVVGGLFFFAGGFKGGGDGPKVTINAPAAPTTR